MPDLKKTIFTKITNIESIKQILIVINFLLFCNYTYGIKINEIMQSNVDVIMDDLNEFPDSWIELYNEDSVPINIKGYRVGQKNDFESAYIISDSTLIDSAGYYLVYCDKESKGKHSNFRLNSDEEGYLYIFDGNGIIVDSLFIPEMPAPNISYGKVLGNENRWAYFKNSTPSLPNNGISSNYILSKPNFSRKGGICADSFYLQILVDKKDSDIPNVRVKYTLDGSEPTDSSLEYVDSIKISKTTIIRAKTFADSLISKPSKTHSYLFLDRNTTLPVISMVIDSTYLYDDEIGIYVKGKWAESHPEAKSSVPTVGTYNYCFNWKRPVNLEYFIPDNEESVINQLCEVRMGGNSSRMLGTKPFVFSANKRFGTKRFSYDFWPWKNGEEKSKSFYLRNGGSDWYRAHIRDGLVQLSFGKYLNLDWLGYQPAILMINGKYKGILNIRERAHEDYIWKNYNKLENVDVIEYTSGYAKCGDTKDYKEFKEIYSSSKSTYTDLEKYMDVDEFMNFFIINSIYSNNDFPGNNYRLWKEKTPGAKWRWFAYDMDQTCGLFPHLSIYDYDFRYLNYILRKDPFYDNGYSNTASSCKIFQKMMSFSQFKEDYINRTAIYMGTIASPNNFCNLVDSLVSNVDYEMPYYYKLLKRDYKEYKEEIDRLKKWINLRIPFVYQDMKEFFSLGDTIPLSIKTEFSEEMSFNDVKVVNNKFSGYFYKGREIRLTQNTKDPYNMWIVTFYDENGEKSIHQTFKQESDISVVIPDSVTKVEIQNVKYEIIEDQTEIIDILSEGTTHPCQLYSIDGKLLSTSISESKIKQLAPGLYIVVRRNNKYIETEKIIQKVY